MKTTNHLPTDDSTFNRKAVLILIIAFIPLGLIAAYQHFNNNNIENNLKQESQKAEANNKEQEIRFSIEQMAARNNAITDWDKRLSKGESNLPSILTIELEQLWITDRPILFIGSINDISSGSDGNYIVLLERIELEPTDPMFGTELRLSLVASKALIDIFLQQHPNLFTGFLGVNRVAVVAQIRAIKSSEERRSIFDIKTGIGDLLEIKYTGDEFPETHVETPVAPPKKSGWFSNLFREDQ